MCDERLYWFCVYERWLGTGWPVVAETFFGGLPAPLRPVIKFFAQRAVRRQLWEQGTGRHTPDEIIGMAKRDIAALADIIGDGPYVHGDQIRSIDTVVYAFAVNLTEVELDTPVTEAARAHANLVAYARRITEEYFPDPD
jgi:glutathione S-transferase